MPTARVRPFPSTRRATAAAQEYRAVKTRRRSASNPSRAKGCGCATKARAFQRRIRELEAAVGAHSTAIQTLATHPNPTAGHYVDRGIAATKRGAHRAYAWTKPRVKRAAKATARGTGRGLSHAGRWAESWGSRPNPMPVYRIADRDGHLVGTASDWRAAEIIARRESALRGDARIAIWDGHGATSRLRAVVGARSMRRLPLGRR